MKEVALELRVTIEAATERLSSISDAQASHKPEPTKWSKKEIIGHLIDSASNNHQRFVRAQEGEVLIFPKYTQDYWVAVQHYNSASWQLLLSLWASYNLHLANVIENILPEARLRLCKIGSNDPVTLDFLVSDYLVHLKHHLNNSHLLSI